MRKFIDEFKKFAFRGNIIDMSVGFMIGAAFGKISTSLINDVFMPALSLLIGKVSMSNWFFALDGQSYPSPEAAAEAGTATINYGNFLTAVLDFFVMALCIFLMIKLFSKMTRKKEEQPAPKTTQPCAFCRMEIPLEATRCPHCTSIVEPAAQDEAAQPAG